MVAMPWPAPRKNCRTRSTHPLRFPPRSSFQSRNPTTSTTPASTAQKGQACRSIPLNRPLRQQDFRPTELIDAGAWTLLPCDVGYFSQEPNLTLWCYPNDTPEDILGVPRPSLEFACEIAGTTCSFEVPLPPLPRACSKEVIITVDGPGNFRYEIH